jgi:hypothetical protein
MELAYPQHRGPLTTLYNTLWYLGSIIAAWTVYGTINYNGEKAWRVPVGLQALMPTLQLIGIFTLPESPRWLCSKDKGSEAMEILVKVCLFQQAFPALFLSPEALHTNRMQNIRC